MMACTLQTTSISIYRVSTFKARDASWPHLIRTVTPRPHCESGLERQPATAKRRRDGAEAVGRVEAVRAVAHPPALPPVEASRRRQPRRGLPRLPGASPHQGRRRRRRHRRRLQPVQGVCDVLAEAMKRDHGLDVDPLTDFVICCGQSEAFAAAIFAIIDQGDEVLLFDPAYETYGTCIELARGIPVYMPLDPHSWALNKDKFLKSFTSRTKAVVLNSPHNPTGKVFSKEELLIIAQACQKMDCFAITDEVYEYITYDENKHISLASLPGMQERTIITSSLSKTYSVTGWRIGWACAAASIASAIRNIHAKLTDSAPAPFQEAALITLTSTTDYYTSLRKDYEVKRDFILQLLKDLGFYISCKPQGTVFVFAELPRSWQLSDIEFVAKLIKDAGVAAMPGRGFFHMGCDGESYHHRYVRFAFCKGDDTLKVAATKMTKVACRL